MEFTLLWAVLTAVALAWLGLRIWSENVPGGAFDRLIGAAVLGLAVGRLTAMIAQGVNPITNPGDIIIVRGGVSTAAATATFLLTLAWSTRSDRHAVDAVAPALLLGLSGWHLGCLWRGACLGTATDLPWGWALDGSDITRHPVEIYAALGLATAAWAVSALGWRRWLRAGAGLATAAGIRLVTEHIRPTLGDGLTAWYIVGVVAGLGVIVIGGILETSKSRVPT